MEQQEGEKKSKKVGFLCENPQNRAARRAMVRSAGGASASLVQQPAVQQPTGIKEI
ncbi:MAG: hypothetical protein ACR2P7_05995 [bacterium]